MIRILLFISLMIDIALEKESRIDNTYDYELNQLFTEICNLYIYCSMFNLL